MNTSLNIPATQDNGKIKLGGAARLPAVRG